MIPPIRGHEPGAVLRTDEHEWVARTRFLGRDAVTRVYRRPAPEGAESALAAAALGGPALSESLPWELRRILEGHRVRAALPADWPLPAVLDAGLSAGGHPYVTRAWIEGVPLGTAWLRMDAEDRDGALVQTLTFLLRLHAANVVFQDLKPDNTVVDGIGRLWFVDLESLRVAPGGAVPCTHYTPRFAAPEQLRGKASLPASDVFAFGRLVTELTGGAIGARWASVVSACLAEDPRARPTASAALGHGVTPPVHDQTIRVPEPRVSPPTLVPAPEALVEVIPTITTEVAVVPEPVVASRRSGSGWGRAAAAVAVLGVAAACGFVVTLGTSSWSASMDARLERRAMSARLVQQVRDGLRAHKTVPSLNNGRELARLVAMSRQAVVLEPQDEDALGVAALTSAWSQRWQHRGTTWNLVRYRQVDALADQALAAGRSREALLAKGLAKGAACSYVGGPDERCEEAVDLLGAATRGHADWLAVEAWWAEILVWNARARRAPDAAAAEDFAQGALKRCDRAEPALPTAPVNGVELVQDCVVAAGLARDDTRWHKWAGWLVERDQSGLGQVRTSTIAHLTRSAAPECARLKLDPDGFPAEPVDAWGRHCSAKATLAVLGRATVASEGGWFR